MHICAEGYLQCLPLEQVIMGLPVIIDVKEVYVPAFARLRLLRMAHAISKLIVDTERTNIRKVRYIRLTMMKFCLIYNNKAL